MWRMTSCAASTVYRTLGSTSPPDDMPSPEIVRIVPLCPSLVGSVNCFGVNDAVCCSCYPPRYAEVLFPQMKCSMQERALRPCYCRYSPNDDCHFGYLAHGNYHVQSAPPCFGYDTAAFAATKSAPLPSRSVRLRDDHSTFCQDRSCLRAWEHGVGCRTITIFCLASISF